MNPFEFFEEIYNEAKEVGGQEERYDSMAVATVDETGAPRNRILLFRGWVDQKLSFFTNYESQKGRDLLHESRVSALFYWPFLKKQIRVCGTVEKSSREFSEAYWNKRGREKHVSALISKAQSSKIESFDVIKDRFNELNDSEVEKFECPENWGGYLISPSSFEFWIGRDDRLHQRTLYSLESGQWNKSFLAP